MLRNLTLAALASFTAGSGQAIAQETEAPVAVDHQAPLLKQRPANPIFIVPPSYLKGLHSAVVSSTSQSSPVSETKTTSAKTSLAPAPFPAISKSGYRYHTAPLTVRTYDTILSPRTVTTAPVFEGHASKNGKIKLLDSETKGTSVLNDKWLEMQERDLIERSEFAPPGGVPRPSTF